MPQLLARRGIPTPSPSSGFAFGAADSAYPEIFNSLVFAIVPELGTACNFIDYTGRAQLASASPVMMRFKGHWAHNHPTTGNRTTMGLMDELVPLSNVTILCGYEKQDATQRNGGIFGSNALTAAQYANLTSLWSDTKTYWQWNTSFINDVDDGSGAITYHPTENNFACVASSSTTRGMELWHNGTIAAQDKTLTQSRGAGTNFLQLGHHNGNGSDVVAYRHLMVFDRVLSACELELMSHTPLAIFEPRRTHNFAAAAFLPTEVVNDSLGITDSEVDVLESNRTEADTLGITDSATFVGDYSRTEADTLGITDSVITAGDFPRSLADTLGITDLGEGETGTLFSETVTDPITFVSTGLGSALNLDNLFIVVVDGKLQQQPVGNLLRARGDLNMSSYEIFADNQVYQRVKRASTAIDLTITDETWVLVDATSGNRIITLPPAADFVDRRIEITKVDVSVNTVTVDADGSETISGALTAVLSSQYENVTIMSDGTQWFIL